MSTDANARGARPTLGHIRGLDGIRALSVLAIIAFHTGLNSVPGGFYGVDSFFVLSGFLITSLLLKEWGGTGTIRLRRFWAGRARRLLPALFLLVAVIGIVLAVVPNLLQTPHLLGDAVSTVFYFSNWYSIHGGVTYFALSTQPSPLLHTWSLAIEEQFYLVWPLVVLAVLKIGTSERGRRGRRGLRAQRMRRARHRGPHEVQTRGRTVPMLGGGQLLVGTPAERDRAWTRRRRLHVLFAVACLGSLASAILMAFLAPNGYTTRAYYGTDTRAQALLVGAAIAIGLTLWPEGSKRRWFTRSASVLAVAGVAGTAALWCVTSETSTFAFSGGFLVASLLAGAVVLGCAVAPRSLVVRLLELPPLPQWGRISYGVYLWYWPVLLVLTGQRLHRGVYPLFLARVGITVAVAALSYDLVEVPIRRGALRHWRSWIAAPIGAAAAISAVFAATLVPVGAAELQGAQLSAAAVTTTTTTTPLTASSTATPAAADVDPPPTTTTTAEPSYLAPALSPVTGTRPVKVLLVGDSVAGSLGVGLADVAKRYNVQIANEGTPGCSLSMQAEIKVLFYTATPDAPCDVDDDPASLLNTWRKWVDVYNPDVVVYVARGETFDQEVDGTWQYLGQPSFDSYVESRYRQAIDVLGSRGATVVLASTPYYDSGAAPTGGPWPEDDPSRVQIDNAEIREAATSTGSGAPGSRVYVFDLNAVVSPGGGYSPTVGSVNVRCGDGVHFTQSGGIFVGLKLAPELAALGQAHAGYGTGWRVAGPSATIEPDMVRELALPVIRRATADDVEAMAGQLARTFWDDPIASYVFPKEARRERGLRAFFGNQMRADYLPFGGCYVAEEYAGSAVWAPAGKPLLTGLRGILTMVPVLPYVATNLLATLRLLNLVESLHPGEPHWYLATLGTAVDRQGKGIGGALMQPVLTRCDAEGLPCYLESSKEGNVPFYRRHGFEVVKEVRIPNGPPLWTMWREPQPVAA